MSGGFGVIGKFLIVAGILLAVFGLILVLADRFPQLPLGRLPGDIKIERGNFKLYIPLATSILLSVILTLILNLIFRR